jgi:3-oxoacyl-[acyl-carrier protein] reductase
VSSRRVALVGGAAGELGSAIVSALQARGWGVGSLDRTESIGERSQVLDMCDREAVSRVADSFAAELGPIDCLILATVPQDERRLAQVTPELWRETLKEHLLGAANLCWAVLPAMLERRRGNIVTLSSDTALGAPALGVHSAAAAAALIGFTKALAIEVAPGGVQVNAVVSGPTSYRAADPDSSRSSLLGRRVRPAEVAATVRYLAEEPHFFAGQVLAPNAGASI